jgi:hypothetical protein
LLNTFLKAVRCINDEDNINTYCLNEQEQEQMKDAPKPENQPYECSQ